MKIGDMVKVRGKVQQIAERKDGVYITIEPLDSDGCSAFNTMTVKKGAIEYDGGSN
jgi:hypothetical protein